MFKDIQPAVKKETRRVAIYTLVGLVLMWIVFFGLHMAFPEKIPFDYTVILGGLGGGFIAVMNFFLMGLTIQKVVAETDEKQAKMRMQMSYSRRSMIQLGWGILAFVAPCFHLVAGLLPLLFPSYGIKIMGIINPKQNR